ncbi:MAG TPA: glycoside hydrolase family 16 protein [Terracidiphilus sp.]|nr:glycoside hydrolase family 16 protein [Terracidiphilus sp.]
MESLSRTGTGMSNDSPPILRNAREEPALNFAEERRELDWLLQHPEMTRSANLVRFLAFICKQYFDGKEEEIREYSIAVEALGRKAESFDSHVDPIVRVTARALRKKLDEIYSGDGRTRPMRIVLPVGHYVPEFNRVPVLSAAAPHADTESATALPGSTASTFTHVLRWAGSHRRTLIQSAVGVAALAAVFVSGFFLGRHAELSPVSTNHSFDWGQPQWSDEFDGAAGQVPDPAKWTYQTGNEGGWGNHEIEIYCAPHGENPHGCDAKDPNAFLDGAGHLVLRARRNTEGKWTSARMTTSGLKNFQYGRIEARMKLPVGQGLWPSFWMLGADFNKVGWPDSGSISVVENVSFTQRTNGLGPQMIRATIHGPRYFGANGLWHDFKLPNGARVDDASFHTYGIIWSPGMVQFYIDDPANVYYVQDTNDIPAGGQWVFDHPFYMLLNLAVGGDWPGDPDASTPNPADMLVDYIRVYKIPPVPAPSIQWQPLEVKAGASVSSVVSLRAQQYAGRVLLTCSTQPATVACSLGSSVVNFSDTLTQEDTLTLVTKSFSDAGTTVAPAGRYTVTITATTISGDRSQLTAPIEVTGG